MIGIWLALPHVSVHCAHAVTRSAVAVHVWGERSFGGIPTASECVEKSVAHTSE